MLNHRLTVVLLTAWLMTAGCSETDPTETRGGRGFRGFRRFKGFKGFKGFRKGPWPCTTLRHMLVPLALAAGLVLGGQARPTEPITVSAAVSLTEALQSIAKAYDDAGGGRVSFNFAGSNVLSRQIVNGAPVDVFISADTAQMAVVEKAGMVAPGSLVNLLGNQLAIVVRRDRAGEVDAAALARMQRDRGRRSGRGACRRLCEAVPRARRPLEDVAAEAPADRERSGRAGGSRERQRRGGDRVRHRRTRFRSRSCDRCHRRSETRPPSSTPPASCRPRSARMPPPRS